MALCETCIFERKDYDEFRQRYVDVEIEGDESPEQHFCPMYDDHIPHDIYYKGADCIYYLERDHE